VNTVEIEQAISDLADQPFDPAEFPYVFLEAFGNKVTTLKRLRLAAYNKSDLGGVLRDRGDGLRHDRRHGEDEAPGSNCRLHSLRKWSVDCSLDHNLRGHEYRLWLKDHLAIYGVRNAVLAPGYRSPDQQRIEADAH
jgi:hypothetical protein